MSDLPPSKNASPSPDADEPRFTQADAVAVTGLSPTMLQNWNNRGLVRLTADRPGRSGRRLYRAADIARLRVMAQLTALGVSAQAAARVAGELLDRRWIAEVQDSMAADHPTDGGQPSRGGRAMEARIYAERDADGGFDPRVTVFPGVRSLRDGQAGVAQAEPRSFLHLDIDALIADTLRVLATADSGQKRDGREGIPHDQSQ